MISTERYITVLAVVTEDHEIMPLWSERIEFKKTEDYGNVYTIKGNRKHLNPIEVIYDIKERKLSMGVELNYYPSVDELNYKVGEFVYYEVKHNYLSESKIKEIAFDGYETIIVSGKKMDDYWKKNFGESILPEIIYCIKQWKPIYVLDNGTRIEWEFKLHHKL